MPVLAAGLAAAMPRLANACAMCGLSPGDHAGHAYNTSVLFMLAAPYVTIAVMGGVLFAAWRRAKRDEHPHAASPPLRR